MPPLAPTVTDKNIPSFWLGIEGILALRSLCQEAEMSWRKCLHRNLAESLVLLGGGDGSHNVISNHSS